MLEEKFIGPEDASQANGTPLLITRRHETEFVQADYFAEEVRRELADRYGDQQLYTGGLSVRTTVDPKLQAIADKAIKAGLRVYDRRHGYRGPFYTISQEVLSDTHLNWKSTTPKIISL